MQPVVINRNAALLFAVGYIVFGIMFGSFGAVSRFGIVFAVLLFLNAIYRPAVINGGVLLYLGTFAYFGLTWLWSNKLTLEPVASLATVALGGIGLALSVGYRAMRLNELVWLLALPALGSVVAELLGIDMYFQLGQRDDWIDINRFSGLVGNANGLATLCTLPLATYLLLYSPVVKRNASVPLFALCFALSAFGFFVTGSRRSALLTAGMLPLVIRFLAGRWSHSNATRATYATGIVVGVVVLLAIGAAFLEDIPAIKRFDEIEADQVGSSYELRQYMLSIGARLFTERPVIGHGYGAFAELSNLHLYSHNNFIEIAVNTGTIGLLLYYSAATLAFYRYAKHFAPGWLTVATAVLVFSVFEMTGVSFQSRPEQVLLCLLLCIPRNESRDAVSIAARLHVA